MKAWPFQKLFSRAIARERHEAHFAELGYEDSVRVRASLGGPFTSAPLLCVPYSASRTFTDDEYIWYVNQRLGKTQPSTFQANPKGDAVCSCAARKLIADGHHLRVCRMGGGAHHGTQHPSRRYPLDVRQRWRGCADGGTGHAPRRQREAR